MSTNAATARRWYQELLGPHGEATVRELMHEHAVAHLEGGLSVHGPEGFLAERSKLLQMFPKLSLAVEDVIEAGDKVAIRWHANTNHAGAAAGTPLGFHGMTWMEFQNGRVVRGWDSWNLGALLQSLGAAQ